MSASTTLAVVKWPLPCSTTTPRVASPSVPPGSEPADQLNPAVVPAMVEVAIDLTNEHPRLLTADAVEAADVVIAMGCGDTCPVFPGKRYLDWDLPDPAGRPVEQVRPIRDDIDLHVRQLLDELPGDDERRPGSGPTGCIALAAR